MEELYFFMGDVLGFTSIISNLPPSQQEEKIEQLANLIKEAAREVGIAENSFQLMSDTICAYASNSEDGLSSLIKFSRYLLSNGIKKSLPIRGAISFGYISWNKENTPTIYGKAVINAASLEKSQEWIGVTCCNNLPHIKKFLSNNDMVVYPPPMKDGLVQLYPVILWDIPDHDALLKYLNQGGLTKEGELLKWKLANKIQNTLMFRCYVKIAHKYKFDTSNFHGFLPIQIIERVL